MNFLTPKQKQVFDFIQNYVSNNGYAPSQSEIAKHFKFRSLGSVQHYMSFLEKQGLLEKSWNARRGVKVLKPSNKLPLLGRVAAGVPIEAISTPEDIEVPPFLIEKEAEYFSLQVKGDSMKEDGILDGDYIVVRKQNSPLNGQTIVALIDNEATLKKFYKRNGRIELHPANSSYKPIIVSANQDFKVQGVFVGLVRRVK